MMIRFHINTESQYTLHVGLNFHPLNAGKTLNQETSKQGNRWIVYMGLQNRKPKEGKP